MSSPNAVGQCDQSDFSIQLILVRLTIQMSHALWLHDRTSRRARRLRLELDSGSQRADLASLREFGPGQNPSVEPGFQFLPPTIPNEGAFVIGYNHIAAIANMGLEYEGVPELTSLAV